VRCYRYCAHNFLAYLHTTFPRLHKLSQLRRDPHLLETHPESPPGDRALG
jgi:hypothetical protein